MLLPFFTETGACAASCDAPAPIAFARGASAAEVTGGSPREKPECWTLHARAGQHHSARVQSPEDNVVFQIYRPGWTTAGGTPAGNTLPRVGGGEDARNFSDELTETGTYLFVLGPRWGSSEYRLRVEVR
jgi:hypothetical protein